MQVPVPVANSVGHGICRWDFTESKVHTVTLRSTIECKLPRFLTMYSAFAAVSLSLANDISAKPRTQCPCHLPLLPLSSKWLCCVLARIPFFKFAGEEASLRNGDNNARTENGQVRHPCRESTISPSSAQLCVSDSAWERHLKLHRLELLNMLKFHDVRACCRDCGGQVVWTVQPPRSNKPRGVASFSKDQSSAGHN